ncbi:multicopper oxidase family protein [Vogesella sp. LIG4]|uniref:multicopper oxidase domain-containing protein n=1 Tax=Vogesella sp. LIG4 TaxID=1192162 RepID=UPI00082020DB|nr:multicopper oxidase family protein [Vogesella sp. LIG4]SCK24553.1 Multicopper oxidase with three cupredoxin domains (includes cell division protein FtsP and spore coat protein CotA) [Vogesella sp. LIG4]
MFSPRTHRSSMAILLLLFCALPVFATSFQVQCPTTTSAHPTPPAAGNPNPAGGSIKCQQISGGDGYATMGDGTQTYMFSFGPLSGLGDIVHGVPGTQPAAVFNQDSSLVTLSVGDPVPTTTYNGAVGLTPDPESVPPNQLTTHVDARQIMDVGVMNGSIPAPTMAIDEDDEFFLTLTNVGMIMRPDLFEQHTVHFHGYPNASSFYDGVPDASVAINIGGSFTYYYLAPDAGTYFWHCHITPPEHLQMGMVGQIFVRPRQNRVSSGTLYAGLQAQQTDLRTKCGDDILCSSPLPPANGTLHINNKSGTPTLYTYNDGDGSTAYDVEYPIQIHGFDPNFHFIGMTFNPEPFTDMKDKYFLLNGRSYPDTVTQGPLQTPSADGTMHASQPLPTIINIPVGGKALLRISDLDVSEYQTLASLGIPMHVIGVNARLLRDLSGNDTTYYSNSITMGGGESMDVILDASDTSTFHVGDTYYLYTPNLDHLSNDAENFGGLMTEVHICNAVDPASKSCT